MKKIKKYCCFLAYFSDLKKKHKNKLNKNMTTINKSTKKNPLQDQKWLKEFAEGLKKDISKSSKQKKSSCG
jgi:hypothetical protein